MYKFKESLIALIGLVSLVAIATVIGSGGPTAAAPSSQTQNVNVVNTPTTNAQQTGNWNVGIDAAHNKVTVDDSNPIAVREMNIPAWQPYQVAANISLNAAEATKTVFVDVPAGKIFVIEFASVLGCVPSGQTLQIAEVLTYGPGQVAGDPPGGFAASYELPIAGRGTDAFSCGDRFAGSQQTTLYVNPGPGQLRFFVQRSASAGSATITMTVSGHLVDTL
jgi:hypothetical protein